MADGRVIIDVDLKTNQLERGVRALPGKLDGLKSSLKGIGAAVAVAFGVKALVNFGKSAIELGSNITEVQNVVDTAFGSMAYKAEEFASTSIQQFGMSRLSAKKTASTYMAMARGMGLAAGEASDMAISLAGLSGDVASFYNITQELADTKLKSVFTGETETLKDLGVVMTQANLQQFAYQKGIRKSISAMTQAELVQLRYAFVTEQLALAQGDFAKTSDSWANQTRILTENWKEFMSVIGQGLIQVLTPLVQTLNQIVTSLTDMARALFSAFGAQSDGTAEQKQADAIKEAAQSEAELAENTRAAAKAAKAAQFNFDELNTVTSETSGSTAGASSSSVLPIVSGNGGTTFDTENSRLAKIIKSFLEPLQALDFDNLTDSFGRLKKSLEPFTKSLFSGLGWAYHEIFIPLAEWTVEEALPRFLDILASAAEGLGVVLSGYQTVYKSFYDNFLKPVSEYNGQKVLDFFDRFKDKFDGLVKQFEESTVFQDLADIIEIIGPIITRNINLLSDIGWFINDLTWTEIFSGLEDMLRNLASVLGLTADILKGDFSGALEHVGNLMIGNRIKGTESRFKSIAKSLLSATGAAEDAVQAVDELGDGISDITRSKMAPFLKSIRSLDDGLAGINYRSLVIDPAIVEDVRGKVRQISDTICNELDSDKNEALAALEPLRKALGDEAYQKLVADNTAYYDTLRNKVTEGEAEINAILHTASDEKRQLTQEESNRITEIRNNMNQTGVRALSETEVEYTAIMNRLKDNATRVSLEQASGIIQNAQKTRDETITAAEEQYACQLLEAQKMLDAGAINEDQYNQIVNAAQKTKDDTIAAANEQYDSIYSATTSKLGDTAKYIDEESGEIKSKWQVFCEGVGNKFGEIWEKVQDEWGKFKTDFKKGWDSFWTGIGNFFIDIWNGIVGGLEKAINGAIGILNKFKINIPNWAADALGALGIKTGESIGFNIAPVSFSRVPRLQVPALAAGAVIPPNREFLAVLGDQTRGRNIETPEALLRQVVRDETGNSAVLLEKIVALLSNRSKIVINVDGRQLGEISLRALNDLAQRNGGLDLCLG